MSDINFYQLLAIIKDQKPKNEVSLEASIKFLSELTAIKDQNINAVIKDVKK